MSKRSRSRQPEKEERGASRGHGKHTSAFAQVGGCVAALFITACSRPSAEISTVSGAEVYEMACAQCHYDGSGDAFNPSLRTSPVVKGTPEGLLRVLLQGQQGKSVIDGKLANGVMPSQAYLTDEEIAAVANYVRQEMAGLPSSISASDAARARAASEELP